MFRIGGEEDLLDPSHAAISNAPERPAAAEIPAQPTPVTPSAAGVLDAPASVSLARPAEGTPSYGLDLQYPTTAFSVDHKPSGCDSERIADRISEDDITAAISLRGAQWPRANEHRDTGGLGRPTLPSAGRQRPGLTRLHIWIAWVNALILAVLIAAAVVGRDPTSTTAASREPSTAQAPARLADSFPSADPATSNSSPKPQHRPPKRRRPTIPAQPPTTP